MQSNIADLILIAFFFSEKKQPVYACSVITMKTPERYVEYIQN